MPGVGQDHAYLERSAGGVQGVGDIGNSAVQCFVGIGGEGYFDGLSGTDGIEVPFIDVAEDPDRVQIGDGGDGVRVVQGTLHFAAGRSYVEHRAANRCAKGGGVG